MFSHAEEGGGSRGQRTSWKGSNTCAEIPDQKLTLTVIHVLPFLALTVIYVSVVYVSESGLDCPTCFAISSLDCHVCFCSPAEEGRGAREHDYTGARRGDWLFAGEPGPDDETRQRAPQEVLSHPKAFIALSRSV